MCYCVGIVKGEGECVTVLGQWRVRANVSLCWYSVG